MIDKVTSFELKLALLDYFRFERQWVAVDECSNADILVDAGNQIIEVEVKISKNDLVNGEKYKVLKHRAYAEGKQYGGCHPNKFLFCVPIGLREDAEEMAAELNPKYGVIIFDDRRLLGDLSRYYRHARLSQYLCTVERAQKLHKGFQARQRLKIARRCSSKLVTLMQKQYMEKVTC